ncbi:uncharacterized protein UTRI_03716_B [Ustilago trichophora]|uniref:DUF1279 domain-containing protein n=1 Tax=Ustilago trichophora TaxID=86804 RepID=A0A5C3E067_9BASI|nr:uncharacterized protein UTRI_03716_B [Ustilago trichophora]
MSLRVATRRLLASTTRSTATASSTVLLRSSAVAQPLRLASTSTTLFPNSSRMAQPSISASLRSLHTTRPTLASTTTNATSSSSSSSKSENKSEQQEPDPDSPPPKASFRERLKFLTRRYGWWALGVYLAASTVDFSLTFLAIHLLGADHIRSLEASLRKSIGLEARHDDPETSQDSNSGKNAGSSTIWTEAVLAYTIHKTLLLPVRVAFTAAVTPSFVKWLVRMGWAKANHQVKAQVGRKAADKAIQDVIKRNAAKETAKHQ